MPTTNDTIKLAKAIADSGHCSRRDAEKLILAGKVKINNSVETNVATRVNDKDKISVEDKVLVSKQEAQLFAFHKPAGYITSKKDDRGRQTIYDILPEKYKSLMPIGRLDMNTEGLLLLTNSGELKRQYELPQNAMERSYRVRAFGVLNKQKLEQASKGVTISGVNYRPFKYQIEKTGNNNWLVLQITEGKNREVRKLMQHIGLEVNRLIRTNYGQHKLANLAKGKVKKLEL